MSTPEMMIHEFVRGMVAMGFAIAGLFFLRFWRESRDRLFALFSLAFVVLALNRLVLTLFHELDEQSLTPYLVRLAAFLIILAAIADKNMRET